MKEVRIFTDGACRNNQSDVNTGGWGAVLIYNEHEKEIYGGAKNTTNNIMELTAIIEALKLLKTNEIDLTIYSDSAYVVNAFQERWIDSWILNGWKNSQKKPVENQELWKELLALLEPIKKVRLLKIKGHLKSDAKSLQNWYDKFCIQESVTFEQFKELVQYNNKADELANRGAQEAETC
ncbi:ribonuclease H family protein [Guggenheimella bovis]